MPMPGCRWLWLRHLRAPEEPTGHEVVRCDISHRDVESHWRRGGPAMTAQHGPDIRTAMATATLPKSLARFDKGLVSREMRSTTASIAELTYSISTMSSNELRPGRGAAPRRPGLAPNATRPRDAPTMAVSIIALLGATFIATLPRVLDREPRRAAHIVAARVGA